MPLTLVSLLSLVIVLGVLISVHEFGHFIVAKAVGIQVLRFSLGFVRPLMSWRRGDRLIRVNADTVTSWEDLQADLLKSGPEARIKVSCCSEPITVHMPSDTSARFRLVSWGILPFVPARIGLVYPREPGARAGL